MKCIFKMSSMVAVIVASIAAVAAPRSGSTSAAAAPATPPNPQVAYIAGSTTKSIKVSNADGSNVNTLFTNAKNTPSPTDIDFVPNANQIVFSQNKTIRLINFSVTATAVKATSVTTIANELNIVWDVDVSPDGSHILFTETNGSGNYNVYVMGLDGSGKTLVISGGVYIDAVWAHSNSRIAILEGSTSEVALQEIKVLDLDANYQVINSNTIFSNQVSQIYRLAELESARTSDDILFSGNPGSVANPANMYKVNIGSYALTNYGVGGSPCLNANDSKLLYTSTNADLYSLDLSTNTSTQLTSRVNFTRADYRP